MTRCPLCDGTNVDSWGCRDCFDRRTAFTPREVSPPPVTPDLRMRKCAQCGELNVESDFCDRKGKPQPWCSSCRRRWAREQHAKQDGSKAKRKGSRKERRPASEPRRRPPRISAAERERRQQALAAQRAEDELRRQQIVAEREEREREHDALAARRPGQRLIGLDGPTPAQLRLAELARRVAEEQRMAYGDH